MSTSGWALATKWNSNQAASVWKAVAALVDSTEHTWIGKFADTNARDTALATLPSDLREGCVAYIKNVDAWCGYAGSEWRWFDTRKVLWTFSQSSGGTGAVDTNPVTVADGAATTTIALPPGTRRIEIEIAGDLEGGTPALTATAGARLYPQIGAGTIPFRCQQPIAVGNDATLRQTVYGKREVQLSGTQTFALKLLKEGGVAGTGWVDVKSPYMRVTDLGPV